MSGSKIESFPPVADPSARVLILGSMPGERSLSAREYYAHPQNRFWPILGELLGFDASQPYDDRLATLVARGIALWDVAFRCRRELSADATMTDVEPNDVVGLLGRCPSIAAVFCNGRKADTLLRRRVLPGMDPELVSRLHFAYLPSTSPAHASMAPARKLDAWRALLDWL